MESEELQSLLAINTQNGKATINLPMLVSDEIRDDTIDIDDAPKAETMKLVTNGETL